MSNHYMDCLAAYGVGGAHPGGLSLTKKILAEEKIEENLKILDAGCGTGQTAAYIAAEYGCQVTGVDANPVMVEKARGRLLDRKLPVNVMEGDVQALELPDASFDLILSESVMAFTDLSRSLPECKRLLKPGGRLLLIEMVVEGDLPAAALAEIARFYQIPRILSESGWVEELRKAGFRKVSSEKPAHASVPPEADDASDFILSEEIGEDMQDILSEHWAITERYRDGLGYRIFKCQA